MSIREDDFQVYDDAFDPEGGGAVSALEATYEACYALLRRLRYAKRDEQVDPMAARKAGKFRKLPPQHKAPVTRRVLGDHVSKVMDLHWGEAETLVSCARDGLMNLWHAPSGTVLKSWKTPGSWSMTCALDGGVAAVGGLDNLCCIYVIPDELEDVGSGAVDHRPPDVTLEGHGGYVSCVRFLNTGDVITASGDASCGLWDAAAAVLKVRGMFRQRYTKTHAKQLGPACSVERASALSRSFPELT